MKTLKIIFLLSLFSFLSLQAQDREVVWTHGYHGTEKTWQVYTEHFDNERQMTSERIGYNSLDGIDGELNGAAAFNLYTTPYDENTIAIAHSMGGLVVREVDRMKQKGEFDDNTPRFGGFITVGTPNHGAQIINNIKDGVSEDVFERVRKDINAGPKAEADIILTDLDENDIFDLLASPVLGTMTIVMKDIIDSAIGLIVDMGIEFSYDYVDNESSNDLETDGAFINKLNSFDSNLPKIGIYGVEESQLQYRVGAAFLGEDGDKPYQMELESFDDSKIVDKVNSVINNLYKPMIFYNNASVVVNPIFGWLGIGAGPKKAAKWKQGKKCLEETFEKDWNYLIGATGNFIQSTQTISTFVPYNEYEVENEMVPIDDDPTTVEDYLCYVDNMSNPPQGEWVETTVPVYFPNSGASDAVVTAESQQLPGAAVMFKADKVNHMEMVNHPAMTEIFNDIFNRSNLDVPEFFVVPLKGE